VALARFDAVAERDTAGRRRPPGSFWQVQTNLQLVGQAWTVASLSLEARFGEAVTRSPGERGHAVESIGDWAAGGATQRIRVEDGMLTVGGDPRPGTSSVIGY
jgi:hypothetical protein